jgi:hypothetical protein
MLLTGTLLLAAGAAACSGDSTGAVASAPVTLTLHRTGASGAAVGFSSMFALTSDDDSGRGDRPAPLDTALIDSLFITVDSVQLRPMRPDSMDDDSVEGANADRHGRGPRGPGGHPDSLGERHDSMMGDSARGRDDEDGEHRVFTLGVVSGGRFDLRHLPTETEGGIVLASGSVPPGTYDRVRLVVRAGFIWLNTPIVTPQGDTLPADTAIPVFFPSHGLVVDAQLTVPDGGGDVPLIFDAAQTFAHVIVTGEGRVIVTPVMRCGEMREHRGGDGEGPNHP